MDILVVEDSNTDSVLLERVVSAAGHRPVVVRTVEDAKKLLAERVWHVVLVDWTLPDANGDVLARHIRSLDTDRYLYVMFVTANSTEQIDAAFMAGADDFLSKPVRREELIARLRAAERISQLESGLRSRVKELESALRRLDVSAAMKGARVAGATATPRASASTPTAQRAGENNLPKELTDRKAWRTLDDMIQRMLSEFLQGDFLRRDEPLGTEATFASQIVLTSVKLGLAVELGFAMNRDTAMALGTRLFGDPSSLDDTMLQDLVGEIANTAMGAVKASFATDGQTFTAGLPVTGRGETVALGGQHLSSRQVTLLEGEQRVGMTVSVQRSPLREVPLLQLREGMILSGDLRDARGTLLISGGTRVTATLAERVRKLASPTTMVEVVEN